MSSESPLIAVSKVANSLPGRYIITLKDRVSLATHTSSIQSGIASTSSNITHEFDIINGYAGEFTEDDLNNLRANPEIALIEEDGIASICQTEIQFVPPPTYPSKLTVF